MFLLFVSFIDHSLFFSTRTAYVHGPSVPQHLAQSDKGGVFFLEVRDMGAPILPSILVHHVLPI